ncbi:GNAT family N-acetyltransferase [Enterobacteriaceae bacterium LUAb1]
MVEYVSCLEPLALLSAFKQHPPAGFDIAISPEGAFSFCTRFDLLTTADDDFRQRLQQFPGYRFWGRWFRPHTCFIGTTVSEYSLLPKTLSPQSCAHWIRSLTAQQPLTIVKDLPQRSPLLSASDNQYVQILEQSCLQQGFISVEGQALAYVPIDFSSEDDYLSRLSYSRRRNLRRKLRSRNALKIDVLHTGSECFKDASWRALLYRCYLEVYQQSEVHFDLLSQAFFDHILQDRTSNGRVFCYWADEQLAGFNLCYQHDEMLIDKYIGLHYPLALKHHLYFVSWFVNLEYARENGLRYYVAGWTDPAVKAQLGASFTFTRHLVWVRNPLLRKVLYRLRHRFESDRQWQQKQDKGI